MKVSNQWVSAKAISIQKTTSMGMQNMQLAESKPKVREKLSWRYKIFYNKKSEERMQNI